MDRLLLVILLLSIGLAAAHLPSSDQRWDPPLTVSRQGAWFFPDEVRLLDSLGARSASLVIDVANCRFRLYDDRRRLLRQGPCATGMDSTLQAPDGRTWTFTTPRGVRRVHHKSENPVWHRPDWSFIEEGLTPPAPLHPDRLAHGMLGEFALDVGQGYLVHGSPYQRGIGDRITHGCVRLADEDLRAVYRTLGVGDLVLLR